MKLAKLFLEFKQGSVYQVLVKLENVYVRTYLRILWTSLANMAISLDLSTDILRDVYKTKEPILIKVDDELYIKSNLVTIVKNNLILSLDKILPTPDELKTERFKMPPTSQKHVLASICINSDCVEGFLGYIDDSNLYISFQSERMAEFSQKLISKGLTIKDLLNRELGISLNSPDGLSFKGKGAVFTINAYEDKKLDLGISNLYPEEGLEALRTYLTREKRELVQTLASL